MADVNQAATLPFAVSDTRAQLGAIARVRWVIFKNSLRTMRGRMEIVSWFFIGFWFLMFGIGGALAYGIGSYSILSRGSVGSLAILFWGVFAFWLFFPLLATAFAEPFDSTNLLRFPLRYSSFFLANLVYGSIDGSTMVGILWLTGIALGSAFAAPSALPWTLLVLAVFGLVNVFAVRALFAWIDRWLAQRRTREIMGILFFLVIIGFQFIGPLARRLGGRRAQLPAYLTQAAGVQKYLPPGLAAQALWRGLHADWAFAAASLLLLVCYAIAFLLLLHLRLRRQFVGEAFGEGVARERLVATKVETRSGWRLPGLSSQEAAIMEKEARYLSRSGPMLFTLVMPAVIILLLHMGGNPARAAQVARTQSLAFPIGAAYTLLLLSNLIYNNFGADGAGVQFFFVAPVRIRSVFVGKNLVLAGVLVLEMCLVWLAATLLNGRPAANVIAVTLAAVLFAAPLDFAIGNLLSLYTPKKYDYGAFGRQRASGTTVLASFGVQAATIGIAAIVIVATWHHGGLWLATAIFVALSLPSIALYRVVLSRVDQIALVKRESLIAVLAKAS